jgi:hypothetical protein
MENFGHSYSPLDQENKESDPLNKKKARHSSIDLPQKIVLDIPDYYHYSYDNYDYKIYLAITFPFIFMILMIIGVFHDGIS